MNAEHSSDVCCTPTVTPKAVFPVDFEVLSFTDHNDVAQCFALTGKVKVCTRMDWAKVSRKALVPWEGNHSINPTRSVRHSEFDDFAYNVWDSVVQVCPAGSRRSLGVGQHASREAHTAAVQVQVLLIGFLVEVLCTSTLSFLSQGLRGHR